MKKLILKLLYRKELKNIFAIREYIMLNKSRKELFGYNMVLIELGLI